MLLQYGLRQEALSSATIWMCVGYHTCSSECPMAIDMAAVMDTLRHMALEEGVILAQPEPLAPAVHRHGCGPLEVLVRAVQRLKDTAKRKLNGLKFVPNYGCTLFSAPRYHRQGNLIRGEMERVLSALGAQPQGLTPIAAVALSWPQAGRISPLPWSIRSLKAPRP